MADTYYITTPIYYPTDKPHLGTAYTTIAADVLARWHTLLGKDVFFLTGTDDHGKKIAEAAEKANLTPQEFTDKLVPEFKKSWNHLNINYDRFIRTTDPDHEEVVKSILTKAHQKGDIYEGVYEGLYCTACEAYYTEKDAPEKICPTHKKNLEVLKEESYFFKLSKYQNKLLELYDKNPDFISPPYRRQEIINRVKEGLQDLSISRKNLTWGIPLPFDETHVTYVWFDALVNYLTGVGYNENKKVFDKFWPADVHIVGKDILWFHAVIWPAILFSADLPTPKKVFAHGWWTVEGEKMGKSAGNVVSIDDLTGYSGVDAARYFILRHVPFGQDGDFSSQAFIERYNNELANKLGNLFSRLTALVEQHGLEETQPLDAKQFKKRIEESFEQLEFDKVLNEIFGYIDLINEHIQNKKPWETGDKKVLWQAANALKDVSILLSPFMPDTAETILTHIHSEISLQSLQQPLSTNQFKKANVLFKKIDKIPEKTQKKEEDQAHDNKKETEKEIIQKENTQKETISFEEFKKVQLKVGKILKVEDHPQADKLYVLTVDIGEENPRTIVAGLRQRYTKEQLKDKKAVFVANLAPAKLRGIESQGMILAAANADDTQVFFITPEQDIEEGSKIR